jgi:magnesium chelatase subunit I
MQEGEMRPQLLDRFGMSVQVATMMDTDSRTQMVLDRLAFDTNPDSFTESCAAEQQAMRDKLVQARSNLTKVKISEVS